MRTDRALFAYEKHNDLKLLDSGAGGPDELATKFSSSSVMYGLCRVLDPGSGQPRVILISWVGEQVAELHRQSCATHLPAIRAFFKEASLVLNARHTEEVTEEGLRRVLSRLAPAAGTGARRTPARDAEELVGTNYRKTNPALEIRRTKRDSFWAQAEREEEQRKEEERRRAAEEQRRWERERMEGERREAAERERRVREKEQLIEEQRKEQARREAEERRQEKARWEQQQREHEEAARDRFRRSESIEKAAARSPPPPSPTPILASLPPSSPDEPESSLCPPMPMCRGAAPSPGPPSPGLHSDPTTPFLAEEDPVLGCPAPSSPGPDTSEDPMADGEVAPEPAPELPMAPGHNGFGGQEYGSWPALEEGDPSLSSKLQQRAAWDPETAGAAPWRLLEGGDGRAALEGTDEAMGSPPRTA
ncbi:drebrin-like [Alligator mississippiensis]|uniref:Drebrin-like n=1 Tax=Alligator mississippiensis TaxID=8496 RepID=A0A151NR35_ALLMI|nr:drebrin-like [Alligator mississippiensis]